MLITKTSKLVDVYRKKPSIKNIRIVLYLLSLKLSNKYVPMPL